MKYNRRTMKWGASWRDWLMSVKFKRRWFRSWM